MNEGPTTGQAADLVEQILRDELARGDAAIAGAPPVLRYLLSRDGQPLLTEATVTRVRGMMLDLASQLLHAEAEAAGVRNRDRYVREQQDDLAGLLGENGAFLVHAQAIVLEADLAERLQERNGIDAVLPPLVQDLAASGDEAASALSMALLAAQARFIQHSRRMELPLGELKGDLFHAALVMLRERGNGGSEAAAKRLRGGYDENASRLALIARTVMGLGENLRQALSIDCAGPAIFATALAMASGQDRDRVVLSFSEGQFARLLLALRAAGLDQNAVGRQLLFIHPDHRLPGQFEEIDAARAANLLASTGAESVAR
jgi:hypothetical protein